MTDPDLSALLETDPARRAAVPPVEKVVLRHQRRRARKVALFSGVAAALLLSGTGLGLGLGLSAPGREPVVSATGTAGLPLQGLSRFTATAPRHGSAASKAEKYVAAAAPSRGACAADCGTGRTDRLREPLLATSRLGDLEITLRLSTPRPPRRGADLPIARLGWAPSPGTTPRGRPARALRRVPAGRALCAGPAVLRLAVTSRSGRHEVLGELSFPAGRGSGHAVDTVATAVIAPKGGPRVGIVVVGSGPEVSRLTARWGGGAADSVSARRWSVLAAPLSVRKASTTVRLSAAGASGELLLSTVVPASGVLYLVPSSCAAKH